MKPIKYDATKLLYDRFGKNSFLHKLNISEADDKILRDARTKARVAIRQAFRKTKNILRLQEDYQKSINKSFNEHSDLKATTEFQDIVPAFWPQGSSVYKTMNNPAHLPPQQIDFDDGVYLPMDMFFDEPLLGKKVFFKIVDRALEKLSREEGWRFVGDKETCSRIEINDYMHLDFPLYAIPKKRFEELKEQTQIALNRDYGFYEFREAIDGEAIELDPKDVYLAMRSKKHWSKSDPKQIENWFIGKRDYHDKIHGQHRLTRVCRFFKAWRDHTWKKGGGPSSIVLMVNVVKIFDEHKKFERDCEAILTVTEKLPSLFRGKIFNPALNVNDDHADAEEMFQGRHSEKEIIEIIDRSEQFFIFIKNALTESDSKKDVLSWFTLAFGKRIPANKELVTKLTGDALRSKPFKQKKPEVRNIRHS